MNAVAQQSTPSRWMVFGLAFLALLAPMVLWAFASPLGSVPDEPSHAIRAAAVVRGEISTPAWTDNTSMVSAEVPAYVAHMHERTCYATRAEIPASCVVPVAGDPDALVTTGNSAGANSPLYYAIVGLPTLVLSGDAALYGMRLVNALLCAGLLALAFMQVSQLARSRWTLLTTAIAVTPMIVYLAGSINPNALEAASATALFVTLTAAFRAESSRRVLWERIAIAALSVVLLVNTRSIALLWVLVVLGAALALGRAEVIRPLLRRPAAWVLLALAGLASVAALLWYANPPDTAPQAFSGTGTNAVSAFIAMLVRTFDFSDGLVGIFGWLDTPAPAFTVIVWSAAIIVALVLALLWGAQRSRWVVIGLLAVLVLMPAVTQAILAPQFGFIWQGRYMLAVFACLLVACGIALDDANDAPLTSRLKAVVAITVGALAIGHLWSFVWALRRYVVGAGGSLGDMLANAPWQPPLGWIPLTVLMAVALGAGSVLVYRYVVTYSPLARVAKGVRK
jgi:hypothetical protein